MFLRRDADILLCYEADEDGPLPFGETITRAVWGTDHLVAVIGGKMRFQVSRNGTITKDFACNYLPNVELFWTNVKQASQTIWDPRHVIQYRMRNRFFEWYQRTYSQRASL